MAFRKGVNGVKMTENQNYTIYKGKRYYHSKEDVEKVRKKNDRVYYVSDLGYYILRPKDWRITSNKSLKIVGFTGIMLGILVDLEINFILTQISALLFVLGLLYMIFGLVEIVVEKNFSKK